MLQLSDNEKRDIIKYLEAGKPLPDKYRFLLFKENREVELVWNGKTNEVTNLVLPFQTIEQIDEPRSEKEIIMQGSIFDNSGRQIKGWTNKLIWGDNKLILSSLKNGPLRKEIEAQGGLKLIYIDPPFDVGADFSLDIKIGDEEFTKKPSVIEEIAYRDTWGKGADSFMAMIYERLKLMHGLLAENGSIYVHCDWRVNSYMRLVLDEIFGKNSYRNEIIWQYQGSWVEPDSYFPRRHNSILYYKKDNNNFFNRSYEDNAEDQVNYKRWSKYLVNDKIYGSNYPKDDTRFTTYYNKFIKENNRKPNNNDIIFEIKGEVNGSVWYIKKVDPKSPENIEFPTQKPEKLLKRIIEASSNEGDLVADFFCGSGTSLAVAEKFNRKWIGADLGRFSIHTSRKRMIGIQRELKKEGKNFRAFEILNVGKYERASYVEVNDDLRAEEKRKRQQRKEYEFVKLILAAYKAESVDSFNNFVGKKRDRLVAVGPINSPVSSGLVNNLIEECKQKGITKADVLGFDYEMGLDFSVFKSQGIDLQFRVIPREVFDKRAVEKGQVKFYEVAYIEAKPIIKKNTVAVELMDFSVFYNQDDTGEIEEKLKSGGTKVIIENGQVIKLHKDKDSDIIEREVLTTKWTDWVDYWAVDFDFESKKEIIRVLRKDKGQIKLDGSSEPKQLSTDDVEEVWTGDYIFENEWQSFRTKKDRKLELISAAKEVGKGRCKIAVKVVDIFGNDTTKIIEVNI